MKRNTALSGWGRIVLIAICAGVVLACWDGRNRAGPEVVTNSNVAQKVQQASTLADHHRLAEYLDARAMAAQHEAAEKRDLKTHYERRWRNGHSMDSNSGRRFEDLIEDQKESASDYRTMADWHGRMAQQIEHSATARE